jgi:hypothetical protein
MNFPIGINRTARVFASTVTLAAALFSNAAVSADKDVVVTNVPLPVTVTNPALSVTGTVGVSTLPAVSVSSLPAVSISSLPPVSLTLPAEPFFDEIDLNTGDAKAVGVTGKRLAVTTLTISNFDGTTQQLFVFNPVLSGNACGTSVVGGSTPLAHLILEPFKTVQLQFPTPMVFSLSGLGCIAAEVTTVLTGGSVVIGVVGYAAP